MTYPALNPIQIPDLVCNECSQIMRRQIVPAHNGKLDKIVYYCDTEKCQYALSISKEHQNAQTAKYVSPEPQALLEVKAAMKVDKPLLKEVTVDNEPDDDDGLDAEKDANETIQ